MWWHAAGGAHRMLLGWKATAVPLRTSRHMGSLVCSEKTFISSLPCACAAGERSREPNSAHPSAACTRSDGVLSAPCHGGSLLELGASPGPPPAPAPGHIGPRVSAPAQTCRSKHAKRDTSH